MPDWVRVIWVRLTWLWGSRLSKAWEWDTPDLIKSMLFGLFAIFANLIFFVPKRKVKLEIVDITDLVKNNLEDLTSFNKSLEDFYNSHWEEEIIYVPHFFYYNNISNKKEPTAIKWSLSELSKINLIDENEIDAQVKEKIFSKISEMKSINSSEINLNSRLILDCLCDSLDLAELKSYVQMTFPKSSNPSILDLKTIWDICMMAMWKMDSEKMKPCEWWIFDSESSCLSELDNISGKKIIDMYLKILKKYPSQKLSYDNMLWCQSLSDFHLKATIIANKISALTNEEYIGIMLPSLALTNITIIATYLAWKVPVMINWTLPRESLNHTIAFSKINHIITSSNFYEKVKTPALDDHRQRLVFLEDFMKHLSLSDKINWFISSKLKKYKKNKNDIAVLLFTSWSESLPKAVALSHENILEDIKWSLHHFPLNKKEVMISFLPPFHSFWFTINTILPLITWLKVANTPDPNDAGTIIKVIENAKASVITATPTFLKMVLSQAKSLPTLRYAVVWAEKCPKDVWTEFENKTNWWVMLEWYWITECSPVVSINPFDAPKVWSIWKAIPNLTIKIKDIDNWESCPPNKQWMIYVRWNSVFWWYLDSNLKSPFEIIDGESYYKTWDLWYMDEDGYIFITWRLKRFVKIAWEMISLPQIEWALLEKFWTLEGNILAVEAKEEEWNVKMVLFTVLELSLDEVNTALREKWISNLARINEIRKIEEIPVLGTGKINYLALKSLV